MNHSRYRIRFFFFIILAALFVKVCILDIMYISGPSMKPGLETGSFVLEFKLKWGIPIPFTNSYMLRWGKPHTGEIVIFPYLDRYVIKRIAATENTPLVFTDKTGYSVLIGERDVPLTEEQYLKLKYAKKVPSGMFFALGDNMAESRDSRDYGFVSLDSIRGKALWK